MLKEKEIFSSSMPDSKYDEEGNEIEEVDETFVDPIHEDEEDIEMDI